MRKVSLVVPVFNEELTIPFFVDKITGVFVGIPDIEFELVFINDGSSDGTLDQLLKFKEEFDIIKIADLSRNFGKEAALSAGLSIATGDAVIPMDVDLQDPPELIADMIDKWQEGYDVVLARRSDRSSDGLLKRITAKWFYRIHNSLSSPEIPENVGDFRLMDRMVVDALNLLPESRRFMKGLFAWVGFKTATIDYARAKRVAGTTKFTGWKLWNFALEGITSFGTAPLRIWTYLGFLVAFSSICFTLLILFKFVFLSIEIPGYASLIVSITFLGGLQLIGIGVIGEYLGRAYLESKRRPVYLIRRLYE